MLSDDEIQGIITRVRARVADIGPAGKEGETLFPLNNPIFGKLYVRQENEIDELKQMSVDDLKKLYQEREMEPHMSEEDWKPQDGANL